MDKYINWELYDEPPEGFVIDRKTGSPLFGYDFYTNGRSIFNGGIRILVKSGTSTVCERELEHRFAGELKHKDKSPKQDPMKDVDIRRKVNSLAREKFKVKLIQEIEFDLMICRLEGWDTASYVQDLKSLIDEIYQKMIKKGRKKKSKIANELILEFKEEIE